MAIDRNRAMAGVTRLLAGDKSWSWPTIRLGDVELRDVHLRIWSDGTWELSSRLLNPVHDEPGSLLLELFDARGICIASWPEQGFPLKGNRDVKVASYVECGRIPAAIAMQTIDVEIVALDWAEGLWE